MKIKWIETEMPMLLRLLFCCGLRVGEATHIKVSDINFERNAIILKVTKKYKQLTISDSDDISIDLKNDDALYDCVEERFLMSDKDKKWYEDNSVKCSECGKFLGFSDNGNYHDFNGEPICDSCAVTNENGFICSMCGYKHPYNNMGNSGQYCIYCESEYDV